MLASIAGALLICAHLTLVLVQKLSHAEQMMATKSGLARRLAFMVMRGVGHSYARLLLGSSSLTSS